MTALTTFFLPLIMVMVASANPPPQDYGRLDTGFEISIRHRAEFPPGFEATIVTSGTYPCAGYSIRSAVSWRLDTLTVHIGGFVRPSPCFSSMSRATGTTYLGNIGEGTYILCISYRGHRDLYRISIKPADFVIDAIDRSFTTIEPE